MKTHTVKTLITFVLLFFITGVAFAQKRLNPTIYFVKTINLAKQDCSSKKTLYSTTGEAIKKVCAVDYKTCVIEGTCALVRGNETKLINYVQQTKQGVPLFKAVGEKCPYGLGVSNICLDPYYTVAADLKFHKAGEVIFVESVKGTKLPNGEVHDGFFIVRDRGGAIKGANRFDFYTGLLHYKNEANPFTPIGLSSAKRSFSYRRASSSETAYVREKRNFPGLPL